MNIEELDYQESAAQNHIVLFQPQIPQNTGNIARTCAATNSPLHIIRPMAFPIDDRKMKRAGLDYWDKLDVRFYDSRSLNVSNTVCMIVYEALRQQGFKGLELSHRYENDKLK